MGIYQVNAMKIIAYMHNTTPCPYKAGVVILSQECKACEYYGGECITQHMRCKYEDRESGESSGSDE